MTEIKALNDIYLKHIRFLKKEKEKNTVNISIFVLTNVVIRYLGAYSLYLIFDVFLLM